MSISATEHRELLTALNELRNATLVDEQKQSLQILVANNQEACQLYVEHMFLVATLRWSYGKSDISTETTQGPVTSLSPRIRRTMVRWFSPRILGLAASLLLVGYFVSIVGLLAWDRIHRAARHDQLAFDQSGSAAVATIGDVVDVTWSNNTASKPVNAQVCSGEPLKIDSGAMEIELKTGVKVVIEGPAEWSVNGQNSVSLRAGKLLAHVPKQAIGFTIETPTARVVDLGTEFGVEVNESGTTDVHVVRGTVEVDRSAFSSTAGTLSSKKRLVAGQTVQVSRTGVGKILAASKAETTSKGTAKVVAPIDLVDIVAGGDGRTHRRDRGINPSTGQIVFVPENDYSKFGSLGGCGFQHVDQLPQPFVDGVAVLDPAAGPVQLTSTQLMFDGFPKNTDTAPPRTYGPVWAGGSVPDHKEFAQFRSAFDSGFDFGTPPNGFIALIPNKLITFDLAAMRRAFPDRSLSRFYAVVGMTKPEGMTTDLGLADTWVFIDGKLRHKRMAINTTHGPQEVRLPLKETDRFLTLASTDGGNSSPSDDGNSYYFDWIMFGNPRIEVELKK